MIPKSPSQPGYMGGNGQPSAVCIAVNAFSS